MSEESQGRACSDAGWLSTAIASTYAQTVDLLCCSRRLKLGSNQVSGGLRRVWNQAGMR
jgi:hypothetical protein